MGGRLHLIYGYLGAGKSTFAAELARECGALLLTEDAWIVALIGDAARPTPGGGPYHTSEELHLFADRLRAQLWRGCIEPVLSRMDVVLDWGFWRRAERDDARNRALRLGVPCLLYHVTCPDGLARRRVDTRNAVLPAGPFAGDAFYIEPAAYDRWRALCEPLGPDEPHVPVDTR